MSRERCPRCLRVTAHCMCDALPLVEHRTEIVIVQHPRERFHPVGTAPLARFGLARCRLVLAPGGLARALEVAPLDAAGTALLYPGPHSLPIDALDDQARPRRLVVLDGTWPQSKRLYDANPWLAALPQLRLRPARPSAWQVRMPPRPDCLSTLESIVAALRALEPDTPGLDPGLDALLAAFLSMNERVAAFMHAGDRTPRHQRPRTRGSRRVPAELQAPRVLVVYGEQPASDGERELLQWVGIGLDGGESFEALLRPEHSTPSARQLAHIGITSDELARGESLAAALARFAEFARDAVLVAWNPRTLRLAREELQWRGPTVFLKAAYTNLRGGNCGHAEDAARREGLLPRTVSCRGRAAAHLGHVAAIAAWLRARTAAPSPQEPSSRR